MTAAAGCGVLWALAVVAAAFVWSSPGCAARRRSPLARADGGLGPLVRADGPLDALDRADGSLARAGPLDQAQRARRRVGAAIGAVFTVVVGLALWPPLAVGLVAGTALARRGQALRRQLARQAEIVDTLPEVVDLVGLASTAGLTVALMVRMLSQRAPPPFAAAFGAVVGRSARGWRLADALAELPVQLGDPVRPLTAALVATERYGVALLPAVEHLAYDARRERRRRAEAAARRLPIRLSFPLVCCILPAFGLLTIAPLLAGALRSLSL